MKPTSKSKNKRVIITLGDSAGIGPEITAKAISKPSIRNLAKFIIIGQKSAILRHLDNIPKDCVFIDLPSLNTAVKPGKFTERSGLAALMALEAAVELLKHNEADALVTAPVSKEAIQLTDPDFQGHTEYLADAFDVKTVGMMFVAPKMRTVLVTRHIPISNVSETLTVSLIKDTIHLSNTALKKLYKIRRPKIAVCGLNPHAGEGNSIGSEDYLIISPAIYELKKESVAVSGPYAADTLFINKDKNPYDLIVAMYHDQGLIPIKTLYFNSLVNLTVGLPFIRTSPAHGTAFDIAGKGSADAGSMIAAIKEAVALTS